MGMDTAKQLLDAGVSWRQVSEQTKIPIGKLRWHFDPRCKAANSRNKEKAKGTLKSKCQQALYDSKYAAQNEGHMPCNASVQELVTAYTGECTICGATDSLHMDHCHKTGNFRGWLCSKCNRVLGLLQDCPDLLHKAYNYLIN